MILNKAQLKLTKRMNNRAEVKKARLKISRKTKIERNKKIKISIGVKRVKLNHDN